MHNKLKLNKMKNAIKILLWAVAVAIGVMLPAKNTFAAPTGADANRYASANHTFVGVNKDNVFSVDCKMAHVESPMWNIDHPDKVEWITVANLNRTDSDTAYTYAPDYNKMDADDFTSYFTSSPSDLLVEPKGVISCWDIFEDFYPGFDDPSSPWGSYNLCSKDFVAGMTCTLVRTGFENPGNQILLNGDITFANSSASTMDIRVPFIYGYMAGSSAFLDPNDETMMSRTMIEPQEGFGSQAAGTPTFKIMDMCYKSDTSLCQGVSYKTDVEASTTNTKGAGEPYKYTLVIHVTSRLPDGSELKNKMINLKFRICPPGDNGAEFPGARCVEDERHGSAGLLVRNTITKAAIEAQFAGSTSNNDCYKGAGSMGFMTCETIEKTTNFVTNGYETIVEDFLKVQFTQDSSNAIQGATDQMRTVANVFLAVVLAAIIVSQVSGFGISNYGIKAMLPRLCVYAVLVNLSYQICLAAIDLSTVMSMFIADQLSSVPGNGTFAGQNVNKITAVIGICALLVGGLTALADSALIIPALIGILGIAIGVIFLFVILAVRQALIIVLIVISPLAIMCNVLPNTRSLFNKWLNTFKGAIIAYPLMTGLVYGGAYASCLYGQSKITSDTISSISDLLNSMMAAAIAIGPVFVAPTVIKGSLGAVNGLMGMAQAKITNAAKGRAARRMPNSKAFGWAANRADRQKAARDSRTAFAADRTQSSIDQKTMDRIGSRIASGKASSWERQKYGLAAQRMASSDRDADMAADAYVGQMKDATEMQKWIDDNRFTADTRTMGAMQNAIGRRLTAEGNTSALSSMRWSSNMNQKDADSLHQTKMQAFKSAGDTVSFEAEKQALQQSAPVGNSSSFADSGALAATAQKEGEDYLTRYANAPGAIENLESNMASRGQTLHLEDHFTEDQLRHAMLHSDNMNASARKHIADALKRMSAPDPRTGKHTARYEKVMSNVSAKDLSGIHADILKDHIDNGMMDHAVTEYTVGNGQEYQGHTNEAQDNLIWKRSSTMGGGPTT